jgi:hypothetical protein
VLAAWSVARLAAWAPAGKPRQVLALVLAGSLLFVPVWGQAARHRLRAQPDTVEAASAWIEDQLEHTGDLPAIATGLVILPVIHDPSILRVNHDAWKQNPWLNYQVRLDEAAAAAEGWRVLPLPVVEPWFLAKPARREAWLRGLNVRYFVLEQSQRTRAVKPGFQRLRQALQAHGRLVKRFVPRPNPQLKFLDWGGCPQMLWRTLTQDCLGPPIEVWELKPR